MMMMTSTSNTMAKETFNSKVNTVKLAAMGLYNGETSNNIACPFCAEKGSFSVTRTDTGLLYNCFRASCGSRGFIPSTSSDAVYSKKPEKSNKYAGDLVVLPDRVKDLLNEKYQITETMATDNGLMYDENTDRLWQPIYGAFGQFSGGVMKKMPWSKYNGPKSVTYWEATRDPIRLAFAKTTWTLSVLLLTEDILSSIKCSPHCPSAALLGTNLNDVQAAFLSKHYNYLVVMLDPDATSKAIDISKKYSPLFRKIRVVCLDKDPKDTDEKELARIILGG